MTKTLTVDLGSRSYPIHIGQGLLQQGELLRQHIQGQQVVVVTCVNVAPLYLERVMSHLNGLQATSLILPAGEEHKHLDTLSLIFDHLMTARHNRTTTLIALGGGVIGDMTGFAAACYQRGVNFIQIPTTLLSQVDSSVGGKTGVNHPLGKNMIGAFYQPQAVIIDTDTLTSLPPREIKAGLAEVIKYGLLGDIDFIAWLETNMDRLVALEPNETIEAIYLSCAMKATIVAADERESGSRALLNFGHTFGHAIETDQGYGQYLHGEAIAIGMVLATDLSARLGWISTGDVTRVTSLIKRTNLPTDVPASMTPSLFMQHMQVDKKVANGQLRLVLLKALGQAIVSDDFDPRELQATLNAACNS